MKRDAITRDAETAHVVVEVTDHGTRYRLQPIPFHNPTGFALDACEPGSMDLAIAMMGDWLGEHLTADTVHTQFWESLARSAEFHAPVRARGDGETRLILGQDIQDCLAGRVRYRMEREPSMETITCDGG